MCIRDRSSVAARLAGLGAVVIDADRIAREVVEPGMPSLTAIRERFGPSVVSDDGILDRAGLGRIVFGDRAAPVSYTHLDVYKRQG